MSLPVFTPPLIVAKVAQGILTPIYPLLKPEYEMKSFCSILTSEYEKFARGRDIKFLHNLSVWVGRAANHNLGQAILAMVAKEAK